MAVQRAFWVDTDTNLPCDCEEFTHERIRGPTVREFLLSVFDRPVVTWWRPLINENWEKVVADGVPVFVVRDEDVDREFRIAVQMAE